MEGNWGNLRRRLGREEEEPDLEAALRPLVERALVEVVAKGENPDLRVYRLPPAIVEVGRAEAGLQAAVDQELAAFHRAWFERGLGQQGGEASGLVVASARRAVPYLVRLQEWHAAQYMIEQVIHRDKSAATLAALLPTQRGIVEATRGTEGELAAAAVLARALLRDRPVEAEALLREVIERTLAVGDHTAALAAASDLVNLLTDGQRLQEALGEAERLATLTVQAGLGPWTQLANQGQLLQILSELGRQEEVLREIGRLRDQMAGLPEQPGPSETVTPWNVREALLDTGVRAATDLGQWQESLALLGEEVESMRRRGASRLEVERTRFDAYVPLIRLGRLGEAHQLLLQCQQAFSQESDSRMLGMVFTARADLEDELGHPTEAVELGERGLPYSYLAGDVAVIAVFHVNLAYYLRRAGRRQDALPHRLAAALIWFQTESGELASWLTALGQELAEATTPPSFAELSAAVERVEGVRFRELFATLPQRAATGDEALAQVLALAAQPPDPGPDIEGHLASWQPAIDDVVAASQGDQAAAERLASQPHPTRRARGLGRPYRRHPARPGRRARRGRPSRGAGRDRHGHPSPDPRGHRGRGRRTTRRRLTCTWRASCRTGASSARFRAASSTVTAGRLIGRQCHLCGKWFLAPTLDRTALGGR